MIELTKEDKETIKNSSLPNAINLSIGSYYVKDNFEKKGANELIGKKLADIFGLVCPNYNLIKIGTKEYVISEDLNQYGEFINALTICANYKDKYQNTTETELVSNNSLYSAWAFIENKFPNKTNELMHELLKAYIYDVLFLNFDRDLRNWGILKQSDGSVNIVIFDNEFLFSHKEEAGYQIKGAKTTTNDEESNQNPEWDITLSASLYEREPYVYEDFRNFLKESTSEFISLFNYYFNLITPEFLKRLIEQIEKWQNIEIDTKEKIIEIYTKHRNELVKIYNEEMKKGGTHGR